MAGSRRARTPAIDIHAHYVPESYLRAIETCGGASGVTLDRSHRAGPAIRVGPMLGGPLRREFHDLDARVREMNRLGVQVHALSLTFPMVYWADAALGAELARATNDAMAQAHTAYPDRFVGLATLPMQDPKRAAEEVDRAARLPGIRGVYLGTNVNGAELDDPSFAPVWERICAHALPVFLHPVNVVGAERLRPYYLANILGNPYDTGIAAARLVFGGVLDRFPKLSVCLPHAGGALPYVIGRMDRGWQVRRELAHMRRRPSAYLRRFTYDTISYAPASLRYLIDLVGADRVMIGSDYCFDLGYDRPVEVVTRLGLSRRDEARILGTNAAALLRLGGPEGGAGAAAGAAGGIVKRTDSLRPARRGTARSRRRWRDFDVDTSAVVRYLRRGSQDDPVSLRLRAGLLRERHSTVNLRADRSGKSKNGRVYTLTL